MKLKNNTEVAQAFANGSHDEADGNNFYFRGDTLYSFGSHYVVSKVYRNQSLAFVNSNRYSSATVKHLALARSALSHFDIVYTPHPGANILYIVEELYAGIHKELIRIVRNRKRYKNVRFEYDAVCASMAMWEMIIIRYLRQQGLMYCHILIKEALLCAISTLEKNVAMEGSHALSKAVLSARLFADLQLGHNEEVLVTDSKEDVLNKLYELEFEPKVKHFLKVCA